MVTVVARANAEVKSMKYLYVYREPAADRAEALSARPIAAHPAAPRRTWPHLGAPWRTSAPRRCGSKCSQVWHNQPLNRGALGGV